MYSVMPEVNLFTIYPRLTGKQEGSSDVDRQAGNPNKR